MKKLMGVLALCLCATTSFAETELNTDKTRMSYALGATLGKHVRMQGVAFDEGVFMQGLQDALQGKPLKLKAQEIYDARVAYQKTVMEKHMSATKVLSETNLKAGEEFLAANKTKEGVVTLPSGLQYKILKAGSGESPKKTDEVIVNYEGKSLEGKVFDSSFKRGEPASFPVTAVIAGWTEALQLMKVGGEWELYIPADLAYGQRGFPGNIEPNATLIFKVDLISIKSR